MEIESIVTQIVVAIIGTVGVICAAWLARGSIDRKREEEKLKSGGERPSRKLALPRIVMWIGLVLLVANVGVLGWPYWSGGPTTTTTIWGPTTTTTIWGPTTTTTIWGPTTTTTICGPTTTEVKISYPHDGSSVEMRETIRGTSRSIPEAQVVWVVVFAHITGRYYPQDSPADVQENGDWSSLTFVGVQGDVGLRFDIIVVVADKDAQNAFNAYLMEARDKKMWPGLQELPDGAVIYDRVTVTRK